MCRPAWACRPEAPIVHRPAPRSSSPNCSSCSSCRRPRSARPRQPRRRSVRPRPAGFAESVPSARASAHLDQNRKRCPLAPPQPPRLPSCPMTTSGLSGPAALQAPARVTRGGRRIYQSLDNLSSGAGLGRRSIVRSNLGLKVNRMRRKGRATDRSFSGGSGRHVQSSVACAPSLHTNVAPVALG